MAFQPQFPSLFDSVDREVPFRATNTPTAKQLNFARALAKRTGNPIPAEVASDKSALSEWIDTHKPTPPKGRFSNYPSAKQVAFAERIARLKRRCVPPECFRDRKLMSRWIDGNKPR